MKPSRLDLVVDLLHRAGEAALATHAVALPGYPFATAVAFAPDSAHRPVLLVSGLAEHSRNLAADSRASLLLRGEGEGGDVPRITLVGRFESWAPSELAVGRHLRYQPEAARFLQLGDFGFLRMAVERIRIIGGFGQAGWLEGSRLAEVPALSEEDEAVVLEPLAARLAAGVELLGADSLGIDLRHDGHRRRIAFEHICQTPAAVLAAAGTAVVKGD